MRITNGPSTFLVLVSTILGITSCVSSGTKEQQASDKRIRHLTDSLSAAGVHGYHVAYFLVGRFKVSPIKRTTFAVSVTRMDDLLLEHPIRFLVLDSLTYRLTYTIDQRENVIMGEFDKELEAKPFHLLIARPSGLDSASFQRLI